MYIFLKPPVQTLSHISMFIPTSRPVALNIIPSTCSHLNPVHLT